LTIVFTTTAVSGRGYEIMVATRASTLASFSTPAALANVNSASDDSDQYLTGDGKTLYFTSNRAGGLGGYDIHVSTLGTNGSFGTPQLIGGIVNSADSEVAPVPSRDGLTLYFAASHGATNYDIYVARRTTVTGTFNTVTLISELNSNAIDFPLELSPDGCTLYFGSDRTTQGNYDLYVTRRGN